jgi:hypothetical protein
MKQLNTSHKLRVLVGVGIVTVAVMGFMGLRSNSDLSDQSEDVLPITEFQRHALLTDMKHDAINADVIQSGLAASATEQADVAERLADHITEMNGEVAANQELVASGAIPADVVDAFQPIATDVEAYVTNAQAIMDLRIMDQPVTPEQLTAFQDAFDTLEASQEAQNDLVAGKGADVIGKVSDTASSEKRRLMLVAIAAVGIFGSFGVYLSRKFDASEKVRIAASADAGRLTSMVETMPMSVLFCDPDFVIRYSNQESSKQLRRLEAFLPVSAQDIVGQSIDVFHAQPAHQRSLLGDPRAMPHEGRFKIGPEHVRLESSAIHDDSGAHIGYMAAWSIVTHEVEAAQRDEQHTAELERVLEQVAQYSNGVASASSQLTSISQQMAANAEETSVQAAVVSSTSDQMNVSTAVVTQAMDEIRTGIGEVARNASEASRVASQAVAAARSTNDAVQKLAESSNEIGNVVEVISSIAEETNLLALNATIEAARAGEAGKGFAVVANEVKELASETGRATGDIKRKIDAIQADTRAAIEAISQIGDIINTINEAQHSIATVVEEQTASAAEMARNVAEVADGSASIAANIGGVAVAAQSTSVGAAETESAASELAQMASELQRIVAGSGQAPAPSARPADTTVAAKLAAALR